VHGELCRPVGARPDTVHILVHGGTYNRGYWNFAFEPETYSYARWAGDFAAFSYDRVGFGRSSRRPSAELTGMSQADVLHQLVGAFRAGRIDGHRYARVVLVGHSLGSGISLLEAATYRDVDGVVLTGITHHISPQQMYDTYFNYLYPADDDPRFAGQGYDAGFLTTRPGARAHLFYTPDLSDPAAIAADEATKDVVGSAEIFDIVSLAFDSPYSRRINAPVLMVVGSRDFLFCRGAGASDCSSSAALTAQEAPYFSPEACFRAEVLPGVGHDVTLHTVSGRLRTLIASWADEHVGQPCPAARV
jgi:pimeloyl-ACP methyl ester carboxylesterase